MVSFVSDFGGAVSILVRLASSIPRRLDRGGWFAAEVNSRDEHACGP